ncbi:MAG: efflux RND transporter periplasmic adaptor subunit [Flavobacteriia bacterium]|nr:efflux RND transporter periplasmic adaptor subunit [Flavobacteriia bacterium]
MKKLLLYSILSLVLIACKSKTESISPSIESITESVYASGSIESIDQYQVFARTNGIIEHVYVSEGDIISSNTKLFSIFNETSKINRENATLNAEFSDFNSNYSKLNELKFNSELAKSKMLNDSLMLTRQKVLFEKNIISSLQLEQSELSFLNSKTSYYSSLLKYHDAKKQLNLNDKQTKNNLKISSAIENDFIVKSDIKGRIYSLLKKKGEMVNTQSPIAIIGDAKAFKIILQVDEYDIIKIKKGLKVIISMDSYKGQVFEANITKIDPIMNERSKSFIVEANFIKQPAVLYPNLTLEANIIIHKKEKTLTIPRKYYINDQYIILENGQKRYIKTGLKDFEKVEVISGLTVKDKITIPSK